MKKNLPFFIFFAFALNVYCHPAIKIFAFEQESHPGTIPVGVKDENGNLIKKAAARKNYFIFLSFKEKYNIVPAQVFIKGRAFDIKAINTKETPVEYTDRTIQNNLQKQLLVPQTSNKVVEIVISESIASPVQDSRLKKLTASNDVVVVYDRKKKKHFITLKTIKTLSPVMNE